MRLGRSVTRRREARCREREPRRTGRRPTESLRFPRKGEVKNCTPRSTPAQVLVVGVVGGGGAVVVVGFMNEIYSDRNANTTNP